MVTLFFSQEAAKNSVKALAAQITIFTAIGVIFNQAVIPAD
jgi:hypothetical protein